MIATSRKSGSAEAAWWAVLAAAVAAIVFLTAFYARPIPAEDGGGTAYPFRDIFLGILDGRTSEDEGLLQTAAVTTVKTLGGAMLLSLAIGIAVGTMQLTHNPVLRFLGAAYVELVRGIPIYVLLLFVYFGLRTVLSDVLRLTPYTASVLALGVSYGAYLGEVIRAGIQAIPHEEIEAATLEGTKLEVLFYVVLPQSLQIILPALANECIALLKDSSLVSAVTLVDITRAADQYARNTFEYFETFSALALVYLVLTLVLSRAQRWLEGRFGPSRSQKY